MSECAGTLTFSSSNVSVTAAVVADLISELPDLSAVLGVFGIVHRSKPTAVAGGKGAWSMNCNVSGILLSQKYDPTCLCDTNVNLYHCFGKDQFG
jgi:hypothetical protein